MTQLDQTKMPLFDAIKKYVEDDVIPFHVPGHKQGKGLKELQDYIGERALKMDVNGMEDLDFANNPTGVVSKRSNLWRAPLGQMTRFYWSTELLLASRR